MKRLIAVILLMCASSAVADTIAMNNAAIVYSPYNWNVTSSWAKTINTGAYFRTIFGGTYIGLATDTTNNVTPYTLLWARVDGGPWQQLALSAGSPTIQVASGLVDRKHLVEVIVKANSETIDRWSATSQVMVTITGIVLDTGDTLTAPIRRSKNVLIYGDSLTEGTLTLGNASPDINRNDVIEDYSYQLATACDCEVGIVGFGGTGLVTSAHTVPALIASYNLIYTGVARSFSSPAPDLVIYLEGTNDAGGTDVTSQMQTVIQAIIAAAPNSKHLVMRPFNGMHWAQLMAAVTNIGSANVQSLDTSGWFNTADSYDTLHPYGYAHMAFIAPRLFPVVTQMLYKPAVTTGFAY